MNLILLEPQEVSGGRAQVRGRRAEHVALIHRANVGKQLRVGVVDGLCGTATVASVSKEEVVFDDIVLHLAPPPAVACTLLLALPRPKVLRRVLGAVAAFGVKRIVLFGARRVERSYWQSPVLAEAFLRGELLLGLEQAEDTVMPRVELREKFRPFVEDELPAIAEGTMALLAQPDAIDWCPRAVDQPVTLLVGPEGGLVDYEVEQLRRVGMRPVTIGPRPLRVEPAVSVLLGRLF